MWNKTGEMVHEVWFDTHLANAQRVGTPIHSEGGRYMRFTMPTTNEQWVFDVQNRTVAMYQLVA